MKKETDKLPQNEALNIGVVIGSAYNERPKDHTKCPECGKILSPAGGTLDGSEIFWACWDCDYKQEDIPSHCL